MYIIIGTGFQAEDLIHIALARRQHQNRNVRECSYLPAHIHSGEARQHEIKHHHIGREFTACSTGRIASQDMLYNEAMFPQVLSNQRSQTAIIFDQEYLK
ncbi:hypothetical protein D3C81_1271130 [compost metagenome]